MKCARLHLRQRTKPPTKPSSLGDKPRRYCQKRMINPEHSEDPRWSEFITRLNYNPIDNYEDEQKCNVNISLHQDDLYLTVQNLKFQGDVQERKRPRTSFKYKSLSENRRHRMFVKQVIDDESNFEDDRSSQLTSYYVDDYLKYILSNDRSRPSSSKSSKLIQDFSNKLAVETDVEASNIEDLKKIRKNESKVKIHCDKRVNHDVKNDIKDTENNNINDLDVTYQKSGKRKSLTISRAPSPETIQVIRVDVVCSYSSSSVVSDSDEKVQHKNDITKLPEKELEKINLKGSYFANKYLLTNTIKSIDEKLSCGSKVTLFCKTFKLSDRGKLAQRKYPKYVAKDVPNANKVNKVR